jgi:hypothetical protein
MTKQGLQRVIVEHATPEIDAGRYYIKKGKRDILSVEADIFTDGRDHGAYLHRMGDISVIFGNRTEQLRLLEKEVYELGYELNGRPEWVRIPVNGIQQVLLE